MKKAGWILFAAFNRCLTCFYGMLLLCFSTASAQRMVLKNPLQMERTEVISVDRKILSASSLYPAVYYGDKPVISQCIDENGDGKWDKLLLHVSLQPLQTATYTIGWITKKDAPQFENSTAVRLSLRATNKEPMPAIRNESRKRGFQQNIAEPYYQMEGPGIENDKVAFRFFFDYRNGKDIYGKLVSEPVLDRVGVSGSWHQLQDWGMDILKVGSSLGAGALAVKEGDRLFRLGDADSVAYTALYEGPLQAAFQLRFLNWDVGTVRANGSETITIRKGEFFYQNEVRVPLHGGQQLLSGMANFGPYPMQRTKHNSRFHSIHTYGPQADGTGTNLGLAILFAANEYAAHATTGSTDSIGNTSYVALKPFAEKTALYLIAGWEQTDGRFAKEEGFALYLQQTADLLANPILITIKKD